MDLLAETQTAVVHNPQSNMNNAVGIADLVALDARKVLVGLGTDAMTCSMLEELRAAVWAQRLARHDPSAGFSQATRALCVNNPKIAERIFHRPLGQLRAAAPGDVVIVDYDAPTPLDSRNALGHLVFGIAQAAVDTTIVGGRVLMQNRRITVNLDEERINARARESAKSLWRRI